MAGTMGRVPTPRETESLHCLWCKISPLCRLWNNCWDGSCSSCITALGVHPADAAKDLANVSDSFKYEFLIAAGLIAFFLLVRLTLSVEKPNPAQQIAEMIHGFVGNQAEQVIGHGYERFQAFVTCIGLFIVLNNLVGLIPGVTTPTSQPWVPLGTGGADFSLLQLLRNSRARAHRLPEAVCRAHLVDVVAAVPRRDRSPTSRA